MYSEGEMTVQVGRRSTVFRRGAIYFNSRRSIR